MAARVNRPVDFPFVLVRLCCEVCKRSGAYRLATLSAKFGFARPLVRQLCVAPRSSRLRLWRTVLRGD
jgi:hypothetical protein